MNDTVFAQALKYEADGKIADFAGMMKATGQATSVEAFLEAFASAKEEKVAQVKMAEVASVGAKVKMSKQLIAYLDACAEAGVSPRFVKEDDSWVASAPKVAKRGGGGPRKVYLVDGNEVGTFDAIRKMFPDSPAWAQMTAYNARTDEKKKSKGGMNGMHALKKFDRATFDRISTK